MGVCGYDKYVIKPASKFYPDYNFQKFLLLKFFSPIVPFYHTYFLFPNLQDAKNDNNRINPVISFISPSAIGLQIYILFSILRFGSALFNTTHRYYVTSLRFGIILDSSYNKVS